MRVAGNLLSLLASILAKMVRGCRLRPRRSWPRSKKSREARDGESVRETVRGLLMFLSFRPTYTAKAREGPTITGLGLLEGRVDIMDFSSLLVVQC